MTNRPVSADELCPQQSCRDIRIAARDLAILALQSDRYRDDEEYQIAVDQVIALTRVPAVDQLVRLLTDDPK